MNKPDFEVSRREFCRLSASAGAGIAVMSGFSGFTSAFAADFSNDELCYMPASVQLQLFKRGSLSPVDVLEAQIDRIEKYNGKVNCITYKHYDEARKAAKESEARWKSGTARALEGITVGMKDEHGLAGWTITEGSTLLKDNKLAKADPIGQFLHEAGAILHIQTTVPEFYLHFCTWTKLWGVTRNPWNLRYTVGASSGGSGAALAAGFCTIATGSDMGGSIRLPCAWNGLYGYKPPFGRVPTAIPLAPFSGSGPMARTFEDMVRMHNIIAHPHPDSITTMPHEELPLHYPSVKGMRIAYIPNQGWAEVEPEAMQATDTGVKVLQDLGAKVERVEFKLDLTGSDISESFAEMALSGTMGGAMYKNKNHLDEMTTYGAKAAHAIEQKTIALHAEFTKQIWNKGYDAIINPTVAKPHLDADYDYTTAKPTINGKEVHPLAGVVLTPLYNLLNWYPVVNVPTALTTQNLPMGMQIVANSYQDRTAMRVASAYSAGGPQFFSGDLMPDFRSS